MEISTQIKMLAEKCGTPKEFYSLVRNENIKITEDEVCEIFAEIYKSGELSDNELENVSGGAYLDTAFRKQKKKLRSSLKTKKSGGC